MALPSTGELRKSSGRMHKREELKLLIMRARTEELLLERGFSFPEELLLIHHISKFCLYYSIWCIEYMNTEVILMEGLYN